MLPNGTGKSHVPYGVLTDFILKGKFMSMKPTVSRRSGAHVEYHPPKDKLLVPPPFSFHEKRGIGLASIYFNNKNRSAIANCIAVADP